MNSEIKEISGGVTAAKGYKAAGVRAGIKPNRTCRDMAMVFSDKPANVAATFTKNIVKAAPVLYNRETVNRKSPVRAIVVNTGYANAATGAKGLENCHKIAETAAKELGISAGEVLVNSTGVIGEQMPIDTVLGGVKKLVPMLDYGEKAANEAAESILTTDTKSKQYAVRFTLSTGEEITVGGMCKGSGMIHPNMGTMLSFVCTDINIGRELLQKALSNDVENTYNMVSVDGDTSTNDTCLLLANGMAGNAEVTEENDDYKLFCRAINEVNRYLAMRIAEDGEGATKLLEVTVKAACDKAQAVTLAKSVVTSSLTKAAIFGSDANWGRILCAMGYSGASFDPENISIAIESEAGILKLYDNGVTTGFSEETAKEILLKDKVTVLIDLKDGEAAATAWGCDLTYDYVKINGDYRT